jgi:hypothetical protein
MKNREIYVQEPTRNRLLNQGVAEVAEDYSEHALAVLRYELETFICEGEYRKGFERILQSYLAGLSQPEQKGVWISGFYGSGKSHLAKMLRILWTDYLFPDGTAARTLAKLPESVVADLREISTAGRRHGGLFAAAGKIGAAAGSSVRLALLGILFKAKGLPEQYAQARFLLWLKGEGLLDAFRKCLAAAKKDLAHELNNLYVSSAIAKALLAVNPSYKDEKDVRDALRAQFAQPVEIGDQEMEQTIEMLLEEDGRLPLTLVVLDELQQYVGTDQDRAYQVQLVTEACCKRFGGRLLFVGTGQSALSDMPNLQKIMGRFPLPVQLSDTDVETVIRRIILAKKPSAERKLQAGLDSWNGEICRHLQGTTLAHTRRDEADLASDYPILPTRRRFWERALRTMDTSGTIAQLRNQLRIVDEAVWDTADRPLGTVVAGDFVFDQIAGSLVSNARLSIDVYNTINRLQESPEPASRLEARLLKLVFLINKLPTESGADTRLRASPEALADLLVENLTADSADLRRRVPEALKKMVREGTLMSLEGANGTEYRLQTQESKEWYDEYRRQENSLRSKTGTIEIKHAEMIKEWFAANRKSLAVQQGQVRETRELSPCFGDALPADHDRALVLWVRDGWRTDEASALADVRALDPQDPTVAVLLSDEHRSEIFTALVSREAAAATRQMKGEPTTDPGRDARQSIESRQAAAEALLRERFGRVVESARVYLAGGREVTNGTALADLIRSAAEAAVSRLYGDFQAADHPGWARVYERARKGDRDCLKQVGYSGDVARHPVCAAVLAFIGTGREGAEVRRHFGEPPTGWTKDAIDGALYALLLAEQVRAIDGANSALSYSAENLDRQKVSSARFHREDTPLSTEQRLLLRKLYQQAGITAKAGEEAIKAREYLQRLRQEAEAAGGEAPAPAKPDTALLDEIGALIGNLQLRRICDEQARLTAFRESCAAAAAAIVARRPPWELLLRLSRQMDGLDGAAEIDREVRAIRDERRLLAEPDPVGPLVQKATALLRQEINRRQSAYQAEHGKLCAPLEKDPAWRKLSPKERAGILAEYGVTAPEPLDVSGPEQVLARLGETSLAQWDDRLKTLASRFDLAGREAARRVEPEAVAVRLPKRLLRSEAEAHAWLEEAEGLIREQLKKGPVSV